MSGEPQPTFALVIPAYNEAATIRDVVIRALAHVEPVIVVDDGSTDGTADVLADLPVTVLRNPRNQGKAASLRLGLARALRNGASAVITLDGDGQHEPEDIPRLVSASLKNPGCIVVGTRLHEKDNIPRARYLANRFANFCVMLAAGRWYPDSQSGFRIYPASVLRALELEGNHSARFVFDTEILVDATYMGVASVAVPIAAIYGPQTRLSYFRPVRDLLLIGRMLTWKLLSRRLSLRRLLSPARRQNRARESEPA